MAQFRGHPSGVGVYPSLVGWVQHTLDVHYTTDDVNECDICNDNVLLCLNVACDAYHGVCPSVCMCLWYYSMQYQTRHNVDYLAGISLARPTTPMCLRHA